MGSLEAPSCSLGERPPLAAADCVKAAKSLLSSVLRVALGRQAGARRASAAPSSRQGEQREKEKGKKTKKHPISPPFPLSPPSLPHPQPPPPLPKRLQLSLGLQRLVLEPGKRRLQPQRVVGRDTQLALELGARPDRRARALLEGRDLLAGVLDLWMFFVWT